MRPLLALVLLAVVAFAAAQDSTPDVINDKLNSIETKPSVRLDPYIRKALLKALSELEESEDHATSTDIIEGSSTVDAELLRTSEDATETLPPATKEGIQIHSFIVNGQAAFANNTNTTPTFIADNKYSIISTTAGNVDQVSTLPTQSPFNEIFQTKDSAVNAQQVRSILSTSKTNNGNLISYTRTAPITTTTTTTTTTTSTTPKPTHNDDGENIEEVDKRDVQVFQAPLVAAFTVQQDAQGLPKRVIPLFQQNNIQSPKVPASTNVPTSLLPPKDTPQQQLPARISEPQIPAHADFISQQLALQKQLEEKQRILEEQLRLLQIQQRQQEELLRKQQFLLQQKEAQRQQQIAFQQEQLKRQQLVSEQQRLPTNQIPSNFQISKPNPQTPFLNQNTGIRAQSAQVSIQQSVPLDQNNPIPNQQQLPNREAVDFLLSLRTHQSEQFPLQENHIPQGIANFLQPNPLPTFNQPPNFNQLRPEDQFRQKQANRVFRHEGGVGNFGVNNNQNFNRFNGFTPVFPNRLFPVNRPNHFNSDLELKQLLAQNGLNARSQEDLNIVSKVLSLNHGIPLNNNINNRLHFDSRRQVRPI